MLTWIEFEIGLRKCIIDLKIEPVTSAEAKSRAADISVVDKLQPGAG